MKILFVKGPMDGIITELNEAPDSIAFVDKDPQALTSKDGRFTGWLPRTTYYTYSNVICEDDELEKEGVDAIYCIGDTSVELLTDTGFNIPLPKREKE